MFPMTGILTKPIQEGFIFYTKLVISSVICRIAVQGLSDLNRFAISGDYALMQLAEFRENSSEQLKLSSTTQ